MGDPLMEDLSVSSLERPNAQNECVRSPCEALDQSPDAGNLSWQAAVSLLESGFEEGAGREATRRHMIAMREELLGTAPLPEERLLVDRVVLCWLHLHYVEGTFLQTMGRFDSREIAARQKWIDRAHRRYLMAIKTLAQVRNLLGVAVQVNIADSQINVLATDR